MLIPMTISSGCMNPSASFTLAYSGASMAGMPSLGSRVRISVSGLAPERTGKARMIKAKRTLLICGMKVFSSGGLSR